MVSFNINDIKDGYVLKTREGHLVGVYHNIDDELCVSSEKDWWSLASYNNELEFCNLFGKDPDSDIVEIYGRTNNRHACQITTEDRELLWRREGYSADSEITATSLIDEAIETIPEIKGAIEEARKSGMSDEALVMALFAAMNMAMFDIKEKENRK